MNGQSSILAVKLKFKLAALEPLRSLRGVVFDLAEGKSGFVRAFSVSRLDPTFFVRFFLPSFPAFLFRSSRRGSLFVGFTGKRYSERVLGLFQTPKAITLGYRKQKCFTNTRG